MNDTTLDIHKQTSRMGWTPMLDGIDFKLLRVSRENGAWTVIFRCAQGASFPPHYHITPGEYYVIRGTMKYRAGVAHTGDYGYEPLGAFHEKTVFEEETELLFTNHGPVAFTNTDGSVSTILDFDYFVKATKGEEQ